MLIPTADLDLVVVTPAIDGGVAAGRGAAEMRYSSDLSARMQAGA